MTWPTVPFDAQSITSVFMYANVVSYVMGQQNTIVSVLCKVCFRNHFNNCLKERENQLIQTCHCELPVDIRLHC